jgi:hypothetical protein
MAFGLMALQVKLPHLEIKVFGTDERAKSTRQVISASPQILVPLACNVVSDDDKSDHTAQ